MRGMKSLRLWVRKLWGNQTLNTAVGPQPVLWGRAMPMWHAGSSMCHLHQAWRSSQSEPTQGQRGWVFSYPHLDFSLCVWYLGIYSAYSFCVFKWGVRNIIPCIVLSIGGHDCLIVPVLRWKKNRKDARDTAMQSRICKWVSKHSVRVHQMQGALVRDMRVEMLDYVTWWWNEEESGNRGTCIVTVGQHVKCGCQFHII